MHLFDFIQLYVLQAFFFEGTLLQLTCGLLVSLVALNMYSYTRPYLMKSNNTLAIFAHSQVSFTLLGALLLKVAEGYDSSAGSDLRFVQLHVSAMLLHPLSGDCGFQLIQI